DEVLQNGRVSRHVVGVLLVQGVVGEHQRQFEVSRQPYRGHAQQERMLGVYDVRSKILKGLDESGGNWQGHREVAGIEFLDGRHADDVDLVLRYVREFRGN